MEALNGDGVRADGARAACVNQAHVATGDGGGDGVRADGRRDARGLCTSSSSSNGGGGERERDASACMRRHQAFALAPERERETLPRV